MQVVCVQRMSECVFMGQRYITTLMETITQPESQTAPTEAEVTELWLCRQRSPHTRSVYQRDLRRLRGWTSAPLAGTGPLDLERFAESLLGSGLAPISTEL